MELKIKTKENIRNIEYFNHNENQILADLRKMATIHSNQIKLYSNKFKEEQNTHHTYTGKYYNQISISKIIDTENYILYFLNYKTIYSINFTLIIQTKRVSNSFGIGQQVTIN
jgi:hypothetical protein